MLTGLGTAQHNGGYADFAAVCFLIAKVQLVGSSTAAKDTNERQLAHEPRYEVPGNQRKEQVSKDWRHSARKEMRDALRIGFDQEVGCKVVSPTAILMRRGDNYAVFSIQTSSKSDANVFVFYVNYGTGSFEALARRGYGPKEPRSEAQCFHTKRLEPPNELFPTDDFTAFHLPKEAWKHLGTRKKILEFLRMAAKEEMWPWLLERWQSED